MEKKAHPGSDNPLENLQRHTNWDGAPMAKYGGFWFPTDILRPIVSWQKNFKARNTDIILTSMPKSGTTWLKALVFTLVNRKNYPIDRSPLLTSNPHTLIPSFQFVTYRNEENPNLDHIASPRIFATHVTFSLLPASIRESDCKIIYICRNLLDQFVSLRHFSLSNSFVPDSVPLPLEESFDLYFSQGVHPFGPLWDQMLEYWNAHLENPRKVLFLKYEDLKRDAPFYVREIAEFIGVPFSAEEEGQGLVEDISGLCSFENLNNLEVNKSGSAPHVPKFSSFFRKGEVGDWRNYISPEMAERAEKMIESKLEGSGLDFSASGEMKKKKKEEDVALALS